MVPMEGTGHCFFPRVSFVSRVSGMLAFPKVKCLMTLRYSSRVDLALGDIGKEWKRKPEGKIKS